MKYHIYKKVMTAGLTVMMCAALVGCANNTQPAAPAQETAVKEEVQEVEESEVLNPDEAEDYSGTFETEDGQAKIEMTSTGKNQYDVKFDVVRLCSMEGEGNWVDGGIEVCLTDPNNNKMYGVFFPETETPFYTLRITQSEWNLIESQTDFTGFKRQVNVEEALVGLKDGVLSPMSTFPKDAEITEGSLRSGFLAKDYVEKDGKAELTIGLYEEDIFDTVDVQMVKAGDTIMLGGEPYLIESKEEGKDGYDINGGLDKGGFELRSSGGGTYRYCGYDDISSYTHVCDRTFEVSDTCVLTDSSDLEKGEQKVPYSELANYMKQIQDTEKDFFNPYNTQIVITDGKITEINRYYMP